MADKKISALTAATTPLAGTEVLPIVQGASTVKVSAANITAGRDVSAKTLTGESNGVGAPTEIFARNTAGGERIQLISRNSAGVSYLQTQNSQMLIGSFDNFAVQFMVNNSSKLVIDTTSDVKVSTGNLVISTAAKGIDFSANTHAPGMTSELLNWYEEGVFTPNQGGGLVVVGAFSSSGRYVRYGNMITVQVFLEGATSIAWASGAAVLFTNLPFTAKTGFECTGAGHSSNYTTSFSVLTAGTNTVFSVEAQSAVANVSITLTYFV
jgi:hypothetical protein